MKEMNFLFLGISYILRGHTSIGKYIYKYSKKEGVMKKRRERCLYNAQNAISTL